MNHAKSIIFAFILVALLSAGAGVAVWQVSRPGLPAEQPALLVLPEPREIPPFSLVDQYGADFGHGRFAGKWSLLFFGFTHCPDVCPGTLYDLQRLEGQITRSGGGDPLHQVVFFSVDPERDSPERLKDYVAYFDPDFLAVTGPHDQLEPLTRKLGIAYRVEEHEPGEEQYSVDHSASVLLVDPEGRLFGVFPAPLDVASMAREMDRILN